MASSDSVAGAMPPGDGSVPPGKSMTVGQTIIDSTAHIVQSLNPIKNMKKHVCTFAIYSHDMRRQIQVHHYASRLSQDFLQCTVYDSDESDARLIGVEYIISQRVFDTLQPEEQKLWHSHGYEVTRGLWVNPGVPEMIQKPELKNIAQTYGKFWCTWQVDRGDQLPMGAPALMVSPQGVNQGMVKEDMIRARDEKYKISCEELAKSREGIVVPETTNPFSDYWMTTQKGFAVDVLPTEMKTKTALP